MKLKKFFEKVLALILKPFKTNIIEPSDPPMPTKPSVSNTIEPSDPPMPTKP